MSAREQLVIGSLAKFCCWPWWVLQVWRSEFIMERTWTATGKLTTSTSWVVTLLIYMKVQFLSFQAAMTWPRTTFRWILYKLSCPSPQESLLREKYWFSFGGWATAFEGGRAWEVPSPFQWAADRRLGGWWSCRDVHQCACGIPADPTTQLTEKKAPTEKKMWVAASPDSCLILQYSFTKLWLHLVPYLYTLMVFCFWGLSAGQVW